MYCDNIRCSLLQPCPIHGEHVSSVVDAGKPSFSEKTHHLMETLEEKGHEVRMRVDAALEQKFGTTAKKVEAEFERAKGEAVEETVRVVEILKSQVAGGAETIHEQQQQPPIALKSPVGDNAFTTGLEGQKGDNVVAQTTLDTIRNIEEVGHNARLSVDQALENKFGNKAQQIQTTGEQVRQLVIRDAAQGAEELEHHLDTAAASLREQQKGHVDV